MPAVLRGHYGYFGMPHNWRCAERVPAGSPAHLVQLPQAAKPEKPAHGLGRVRGSDCTLPSARSSDHSPLGAASGMTRVTSREEPGAGKPPARICEGESRMAELLDHDPAPIERELCCFFQNTNLFHPIFASLHQLQVSVILSWDCTVPFHMGASTGSSGRHLQTVARRFRSGR